MAPLAERSPKTLRRIAAYLRYLASRPLFVSAAKVGDIVGKLAVFVAILAWLIEIPARQQQAFNSAWTLINLASSQPGDAGRSDALQVLADGEVSLAYIDLRNAKLRNTKLKSVDLSHSSFLNAQLTDVSFECRLRDYFKEGCSDFDFADFTKADLRGVDFSKASLWSTKFVDTLNLKADFSGARLAETKFWHVSIDAQFRYALLDYAVFDGFTISYDPKIFEQAILHNVNFVNGDLPTSLFALVKRACNVKLPNGENFNLHCPKELDGALSDTPVHP